MPINWLNEKWNKRNWHAVDLDGTLAVWTGFQGATYVGPPIPPVLRRVRVWLKKGEKVKIFTARIDDRIQPNDVGWERDQKVRKAIQNWTQKWLGKRLEVTNCKDKWMRDLLDDRAEGIEMNTGKRKTVMAALQAFTQLSNKEA